MGISFAILPPLTPVVLKGNNPVQYKGFIDIHGIIHSVCVCVHARVCMQVCLSLSLSLSLAHTHKDLIPFGMVVFFSIYSQTTCFKCHRHISGSNLQKHPRQIHLHSIHLMNFDHILVHPPLHYQLTKLKGL